jgi:predicted acylesterase/phospholipase RssA
VAALLHRDWVNAKAGGVRRRTEGVEVMACTGLVLQGGGALGAFEYGALLRLYEEPAFSPDIISGVSIGAINAACLVGAKDDPVKTLQFVWDRFTVQAPWLVPPQGQRFLALFGNPSFFNMRYDYLAGAFWTSFYRTDPLRRLLHETIDFDKLNNSPINLVLSATNVRTGDIEIFDNRTTRITAEHIIASGSLPPGFPMTAIEGEWYWDGGLFNNTPLSPVIERLDPSPDVKRHLYVIDLFPNAGKVPSNMLDVMDRMFELIFSNKLVKNVEMTRRVDEFIQALDEIEAHLPPEARERVTKLPGYQRLRQYKIIKNLVVIANEEPELGFGPFDFSQQTIKKRIEAGYQAAARRLALGEEPGAPMEPGSAGDRAAGTGKRRRKRRDERIEGFSNLLRERLRTDHK